MAKQTNATPADMEGETRSGGRKEQPIRTGPAGNRGVAVVGIGASAGGLDAFRRFFSAAPGDLGVAFVLIQHLDPTHESLTAELLGKHTEMSVVQVVEEMVIEPNHVYVIPPNKYLTISGKTLHLSEPVQRRGVRVPIDFFFRSLADDQQSRAIGIILSGTGSDGTLGAGEIKAAGGIVMVQSPDTAQYDGMPRSAMLAGVVDCVLPVDEMPDMLLRYVGHSYVNDQTTQTRLERSVTKASSDLTTIVGLLRARVKYDFSYYKKGTLTRRIQRRMGLRHVEAMDEYIERLRQDDAEVTALYKDLLISVTNFFRDPPAWLALEKHVIGPLVAGLAPDPHRHDETHRNTIRVWTPGCASGEEPFSLAMLLTERMQAASKDGELNLFASDIDHDAVAFARAGVYPETIAADVTPERLQRFFTKGEHTYRINKEIRETVVFAEQNVISDPPFSKLDLISCRNLLIYLEPDIQKKILSMFHFALRDGGYLFLGNAETITQQSDLFVPVSREWRIYQRSNSVEREYSVPARASRSPPPEIALPARGVQRRAPRLPAAAQQLVLQRFAPACALVDRSLKVVYLHGPVDDYLQLPSGEQTYDLIAMSRQGLRTKLRVAVQQAIQTNKPVALENVQVRRGQQFCPVRVSIEPLRQPDELSDLLLLAFEEADAEQRVRLVYVEPSEAIPPDEPDTVAEYQAVIRQLERDLTETREDLQTSIEEFETSNEEFKAANEEVTSINEELQSTNEELETSQEELQSLNEEMQTVNNQLESKVGELESVNNDLNNLLSSIDHATLFLDRQFRVKRFTPATANLLRVIETDIGRPFSDFAKNFSDEDLLDDAANVLKHLAPMDKEIRDERGHWYVRRIVPYRTEEDRIDGVVITFIDITERNQARESLQLLNASLEQQVIERTKLLQLVHDITAFANQTQTVDEALSYAIDRICQYDGWQAGQAFRMAGDGSGAILPTEIWHQAEGMDVSQIRRVTCRPSYAHSSDNLIDDVVAGAALRWVADIQTSTEYPRHDLRDLGVQAIIAFPVLVGNEVVAVLEFYSQQSAPRDERFVDAIKNIGVQLGYVVARRASDRQMAKVTLEERERLGRELHDSLGQQISALGMLVESLRHDMADDSSAKQELLEKLKTHIETSQRQIRSLMVGLEVVNVEGGGLPAALERLAVETSKPHGPVCRFVGEHDVTSIDSFAATQLFLIASEAAHNAAKHAQADQIVIRLTNRAGIQLSIADNGVGLASDSEHSSGMGIRIMRHRASLIEAALRFESPSQGGTLVRCTLAGKMG
ncbi:Chemotaxis protein methyltransferase [Stieleria neptunia]|uniref:Chemotaxis protein methyltransferase n=1 Tax=Stieleria neptunia TaxID=2527979 RepID=A0A518I2Q6_9BACT|nr:chemotaxis protein CheB [Stieleria neptunia]QDV47346.1 Chemotaxis protein methyltransferase [Stieleria neptunia]